MHLTGWAVVAIFAVIVSAAIVVAGLNRSTDENDCDDFDMGDFVRFDGVTYARLPSYPRATLTHQDLGPIYATVRQNVGTIATCDYRLKDGEATTLAAGTSLHTLNGYNTHFRLALSGEPGAISLYEVYENTGAERGADLLDIGGKVTTIRILKGILDPRQLTVISDQAEVTRLVKMILAAPVDHGYAESAPGDVTMATLLVFVLADGTATSQMYFLDQGRFRNGIAPLGAFREVVQRAVEGAIEVTPKTATVSFLIHQMQR